MMEIPEYTDGRFKVFKIIQDNSTDFPIECLTDLNMTIWYREISVFDRVRYELGQGGKEVTMKVRIPQYKGLDSKCMCEISGCMHQVYNVAHVKDKYGFPETELTLIQPEKEIEIV